MDQAFSALASFYDFECKGCDDNCCTTHFYHYTMAEKLYLFHGLSTLNLSERAEALQRAQRMCAPDAQSNYLCPVNVNGRCTLYSYRTMICRLHGLPYLMIRPDGKGGEGPGCAKFERERTEKGRPYRRIDRTPFYQELAFLERKIRQELSVQERSKKTIAEMLVEWEREEWRFGVLK
jgi:hypothetical protein